MRGADLIIGACSIHKQHNRHETVEALWMVNTLYQIFRGVYLGVLRCLLEAAFAPEGLDHHIQCTCSKGLQF
jgi:hypothetical protein